ncbi:MAG: aldehyde ferredoxin oxidoreductase N-terminal domain-containing protein [Dehalococcoidia bacterium]|nr:aldehyde ferredoxin oxidoreductase N-terminal domain-containing protein [Dehalococcoidia bacterium]
MRGGYAGRILRVDLSSGKIAVTPTSDYAERFLGGRGIAAKVYWDEVPPGARALDEDNTVIFATGPVGGVPAFAGSRWTVCGRIPEVERFSYGNFGGRWGAALKFAGCDAVVVHGKSERPVYIFIRDGIAELKDASALWGRGAIETREALKSEWGDSTRVVAIGQAGENMAVMANLIADNDAAGSKGVGAVLGSKKLKALAVKWTNRAVEVAQPDRVRELADHYRSLKIGFPYYDEAFHNVLSRWSHDPRLEFRTVPGDGVLKKEPCYGCLGRCPRTVYRSKDGRSGKFICHSAWFYQPWAERFYKDWNDVPFHATKLCDDYGLDTIAVDLTIGWLNACYEAGLLTDENTGLPLSRIGSQEFIEALLGKLSRREGFGDLLAQGLEGAADSLGTAGREQLRNVGILSERGYSQPYGPRLYIMTGLLWAMEPRLPISVLHEVTTCLGKWLTCHMGLNVFPTTQTVRRIAATFWGSEVAADFSTYEGKALAVKKIQDRSYAKECLILCDWLWPIMELEFSEDHVGDPTLESRIVSAITGQQLDEDGLNRIGERVFNLQRAILVREGHRGRASDTIPEQAYTEPLEYEIQDPQLILPGKNGEVVSLKGRVIDRDAFERMKDEYYLLRRWDVTTGLQTRAQLEGIGLVDVARDMEARGLLAGVDR